MNRKDKDALRRALAAAIRRDKSRKWMFDKTEKAMGWQRAAEMGAFEIQMMNLHLHPWQSPPCKVDPNDEHPDRKAGAMLLRKMLDAKLSRYEPDPVSAIREAERARAAATPSA